MEDFAAEDGVGLEQVAGFVKVVLVVDCGFEDLEEG